MILEQELIRKMIFRVPKNAFFSQKKPILHKIGNHMPLYFKGFFKKKNKCFLWIYLMHFSFWRYLKLYCGLELYSTALPPNFETNCTATKCCNLDKKWFSKGQGWKMYFGGFIHPCIFIYTFNYISVDGDGEAGWTDWTCRHQSDQRKQQTVKLQDLGHRNYSTPNSSSKG